MHLHSPHDFAGHLRARIAALDVPDCGCPVFDRCPECGAAHDADCIHTCRICEAEWPAKDRPVDRCPCCAMPPALTVMTPIKRGGRALRHIKIRLPCPRETKPRPCLWPPCEHVLAVDHELSLEEWAEELLEHDETAYLDRPEPAEAAEWVLPGPAKVEVMADREADDEALWHLDDATYERLYAVGREGQTTVNGTLMSARQRVRSRPRVSQPRPGKEVA